MATTLTPLEAALVDTVRVALTSSSGGLRQFVRRLAKNPPAGANKVELQAQLSALIASAPPDTGAPLRRSQPALGLRAPLPPKAPEHGDPHAASTRAGGSRVRRAARSLPEEAPDAASVLSRNAQRPVLPPATQATVDELIQQWRSAPLLAKHGLTPASKVLFVGPPGVGKTMTAAYIASELALPLITVDPTAIMSSYLGSSAKNLRDILEAARARDSIVFFDEFDALAKSRDDAQDIGEAKRVVNSLLLELDRTDDDTLVIAATNFDQVLDSAVHRRFDSRVDFPMPGATERRRLIAHHPALVSLGVGAEVVNLLALATHDWSPSRLDRSLSSAARSAVLSTALRDDSTRRAADVIAEWAVSLANLTELDSETRKDLAFVAVNSMGYSHRQAGEMLGVSHPTISKWLKAKES